jgi:hypothetical protein
MEVILSAFGLIAIIVLIFYPYLVGVSASTRNDTTRPGDETGYSRIDPH